VKLLDSNIWLYALVVSSDPVKRTKAIEYCAAPDICVTSQIVNEVLSNLLRKESASEEEIRKVLDEFYSQYLVLEILQSDIQTASELREEYRFSYWDSLIVATALRANAEILYSEDMQDGLVVRGSLTIRNPFK
jgi:predicted nucleic acid-binding protein